MKPSQLGEVIAKAIENRHPLLIVGPPGIGKSDIVAQSSGKAGTELLIFHPVISDPTDFKGLPFARDGEAVFLPFGELKALVTAGRPTVAFLDDLGQAPASVQAAAMQLLLARRIGNNRVSDQVTFIAATNRLEDRAGVQGILEPVKSRFVSIINLEVDVEEWVRWAVAAGLPDILVSFIRFRPAIMKTFRPVRGIENCPSPRTVAFAGTILNSGYDETAVDEMISGACGQGFASEFKSYRKIQSLLPDVDRIIAAPRKAEVPKRIEITYALIGALASRADNGNFAGILGYSRRLGPEFGMYLVKECLVYNPALAETDTFREWSVDNQDLLG